MLMKKKTCSLFLLERYKALQESWGKDTAVLENENLNPKQKKYWTI